MTILKNVHLSTRDKILYFFLLSLSVVVTAVLWLVLVPQVAMTAGAANPNGVLPIIGQFGEETSRAVAYRLDYCKHIDATSTALRVLQSSDKNLIVSLYSSGFALPEGCNVVDIVEPMPAYIPPGIYRLKITFIFRTNAITIPAVFQTEEFRLQ